MEFITIAKQMREEFRKLEKEYKIDFERLFIEPNEENPAINKMILDVLYKYSKIKINKEGLFEQKNREILLSSLFLDDDKLGFGDKFINRVIKTYLNSIWNVFVKDDGSHIVHTGAEEFELTAVGHYDEDSLAANNSYIEKKIGNIYLNKNRQLAMFILPDGTCYYAPKDHMGLAAWLNLNAIDIKGALRLEINDDHQGIDLSSLGGSMFSKESNSDYLIEITQEQAEVFASVFKSVRLTRKKDVTLEDCLYKSYGLGCSMFAFDEKVGVKNVRRIAYEFGDFKKNAYLKQLRDFHEDLNNNGQSGGIG